MKNCLIAYYSQNKTTEKIANEIKKGMESSPFFTVELCNIAKEKLCAAAAEKYDIIGIGSPTYYYRPPFAITDFLYEISSLKDKEFFTFVLYGTYKGDTGNIIRKSLKLKGGSELGYFYSKGADYFIGYLRENYLFSYECPTKQELEAAYFFGKSLSEPVENIPFDPPAALINRFERFILSKKLFNGLYLKFFKADKQLCTKCGLCIKNCPSGNIFTDEEGFPVWDNYCTACLSCEMNCPYDAVQTPFRWMISKIFLRKNVNKAKNDESISKVRVLHKNGKTYFER